MVKERVRIGGGSACAEDWIDPAVELAEKGSLDYLCFDSLSEAELSVVALNRLENPYAPGYDIFLDDRIRAVLPSCVKNGVKIVGNMGSGDPVGAQRQILKIASELGVHRLRVASVTGDDILSQVQSGDIRLRTEDGRDATSFGSDLISAHAYVPADPISGALDEGADIVITGRVGDSALFLGPLVHEFGWPPYDWDRRAKGIMVGHLLECAGQLCGGYFADPPFKIVKDLHRIGFPFAEVTAAGDAVFTKVPGSGGAVTTQTCAEQLLYEVGDPTKYTHADVVVDFSRVSLTQVGPDRVEMNGNIIGKPAPHELKVALGVREGFLGQSVVYYGGLGAYNRARFAEDLLRSRLDYLGLSPEALRIDLIGVNALYGEARNLDVQALWEVGLRVAVRTCNREEALAVCREGSSNLSNNGPAAVTCRPRQLEVREIVGFYTAYVSRLQISQSYTIEEV